MYNSSFYLKLRSRPTVVGNVVYIDLLPDADGTVLRREVTPPPTASWYTRLRVFLRRHLPPFDRFASASDSPVTPP